MTRPGIPFAAAAAVAVLIALTLIFSDVLLASEAGHECCGADCPVCRVVAAVEGALGETLAPEPAEACAPEDFARAAEELFTGRDFSSETIVELKVKLSA